MVPKMTNAIPDIEWIFGYGSLMWRPGFPYLESHIARLDGFHRAACIYSHHHRGTIDTPGLVLGLDEDGICDGISYRIDINKRQQIIDYLIEREMIGYAYRPIVVPICIGNEVAPAYTFVADSAHENYAGNLGLETAAEIIVRASGVSGLNRDYLINTVEKLQVEGFAEPELGELLRHVRLLTGKIDLGSGI